MASFVFNSFWGDLFKGAIDVDTDTFKRMLVTVVPSATNKDGWTKRSDVTNEHAATGNYATGGAALTASVPAVDNTNDRQDATFGVSTWGTSTISAVASVIYKARGGASTADELVMSNDFGGTVSTTSGTFTANADSIRVQN